MALPRLCIDLLDVIFDPNVFTIHPRMTPCSLSMAASYLATSPRSELSVAKQVVR